MDSNFKKVCDLYKVFNQERTTKDDVYWAALEKQLCIIKEEFKELEKAVEEKDWEELKDATGDVLVTTYGMGYCGSFDCDKLMNNISESNFSKLCHNDQEVQETILFYKDLGVNVEVSETFLGDVKVWAILSAEDQTYNDNGVPKSIKKGKFLKNVNWKKPNLDVEN